MLHLLAHGLLKDLSDAGAVIDPKGEVLEVNDAFKTRFYEKQAGGQLAICLEFQTAIHRLAAQAAGSPPIEAEVIHRKTKSYRLDVYFLDKNTGEDGLRLVVVTRIDPPNAKMQTVNKGAPVNLSPAFSGPIGRAPGFIQALLLAQRAAQTDLPVLILGESGTGKEILAKTIHQASRRQNKRFVDVNCAAIPDSLVESELFGYEKGAFTGASSKGKAGFFEDAHQGTIFMDEIGDAASQTQAKLLRVLESGQFKRIGGNRNIKVDVRLISATNQELGRPIADGRFRADLLYRINTITIRLPPLRDRLEDLILLADHFLKNADMDKKGSHRFSRDAMEMLKAYSWPGNVRELKGVVDYAVTMAAGSVLTPRSFPGFLKPGSAHIGPAAESSTPSLPSSGDIPQIERRAAEGAQGTTSSGPPDDSEPASDLLVPVVERVEKLHIENVLEKSQTRSEAIRRLGISRRTFYAKLKQYGLV